ncbi:stress enhanced protein 2, chloroplastic [Magnolia sinica]|uniref:stress enhanced protein 2, chloroplastic n=1 Tax=Magnolia sinica TaxID=86752 RepID=UPI00265B1C06|nr:stress enhanced protein 2, chloroplastic [Magnolia sinica]
MALMLQAGEGRKSASLFSSPENYTCVGHLRHASGWDPHCHVIISHISGRRVQFNNREDANKSKPQAPITRPFPPVLPRQFFPSFFPMAATAARAIFCELIQQKSPLSRRESAIPRLKAADSSSSSSESAKIILQPRVCTLRSYGSGRDGLIRTRPDADVSPFFASLSDYIENSKNSQDFETISGRLAMVVFAGAVTVEVVTGNSLFRKMDLQAIAEASGVCFAAVVCAAAFAWISSARTRVGRIFTVRCNTFVDSLVDNIVDGLFYESELSDWSDEI